MLDQDHPLKALLASKSAEGRLDSSAEFTINSLKARRKLSQSQLPQEGLWLVKLVQAAVSCQAREIEVSFGKREVLFQFSVSDWPWEPRALLEDLLSGVLPTETCLLHLFAGLRNSLFEDTIEAEWHIGTSKTSFTAHFDSEGTRITENPPSEECGFRLKTSRPLRWPGLKKAAPMPVKHLLRRTADEFMAVNNYCWPCPVPLKVDGRWMECRYRLSPSFGEDSFMELSKQTAHTSSVKMRPVQIVRRELPGPQPLELVWPLDGGEHQESPEDESKISLREHTYLGQTWMTWPLDGGETPGACLLLLFGAQLKSRIDFVCDGAIVHTHELPWASKVHKIVGQELHYNQFKVGVRVLIPISAEQLDLSHFAVREKEELLASWLPKINVYLEETCEKALAHAKLFKPQLTNQPKNLLGKAVSGYISLLIKVHPLLHYLVKYGFRNELKSLLESVRAE